MCRVVPCKPLRRVKKPPAPHFELFRDWLEPPVPASLRLQLERRQLESIQRHVPLIYLVAILNVGIVMAACVHQGLAFITYGWMVGVAVLFAVRGWMWTRVARRVLSPDEVSAALRGSAWVAFLGACGLSAFSCVTFVWGTFGSTTFIPTSLAFGSMTIAHCFASVRRSAVLVLCLGVLPSAAVLLVFGDFNARVLGVSMLSVALVMIRFVAGQFDVLVTELQLQHEVHVLANTDALTNLHNRRSLVAMVEGELAAGTPFAIALLDLDGFKDVNDRLGHLAGDELLRVVGGRLAQTPQASAGRLGGDEFMVVLHQPQGVDDAQARFSTMMEVLCQPTTIAGEELPVRSSLGWSFFPRDGSTSRALLAVADDGLYANKRARAGSDVATSSRGAADRRRNRP